MPSGGNIIFDTTEALTSIDVNSAKSTKGGDIEETALNTNLEAAVAICNQLKLRDIGGLLVVDYIDMMSRNSQRTVMRKMAELAKHDKAKIQFSPISKFGLMEISRQKLRSSIIGNSDDICPTCNGSGYIKSLSSLAISLVRMLEEEAVQIGKSFTVYLPVRLATYLLNEKRELIQVIEDRHDITIKLIPDPEIDATSHLIDKENLSEHAFKATLNSKSSNKDNKNISKDKNSYQKALVTSVTPKTLPPKPKNRSKSTSLVDNILKKIKSIFIKQEEKPKYRANNGRKRYGRSYNSRNSRYKSFNKKRNNQSRHNSK